MIDLSVNSTSNKSTTEINSHASINAHGGFDIDILDENKTEVDEKTTHDHERHEQQQTSNTIKSTTANIPSDLQFETQFNRARKIGLIKINLFGGILLSVVLVLIVILFANNDAFIVSFGVSYVFFSFQCLLLASVTYWYYVQEKFKKQNNYKHRLHLCSFLHLIKEKFSILSPIITQFADVASDIGVMIDFYYRSEQQSSTNEIDYLLLFLATLGILILYRIISAVIVYSFNKILKDTVLQFFDLYIFKIVRISIENGLEKSSRVQKSIKYMERGFELRQFVSFSFAFFLLWCLWLCLS